MQIQSQLAATDPTQLASTTTTPAASTSSTQSAPQTTDPTAGLANESTFLQLLVAQIKNQDPLQPTDGAQFLTQLAQFSQLEQLIGIRSELNPQTPATSAITTPTSNSATTPTTN
jgi:flagellar basal-body rod modification protein FlgD